MMEGDKWNNANFIYKTATTVIAIREKQLNFTAIQQVSNNEME